MLKKPSALGCRRLEAQPYSSEKLLGDRSLLLLKSPQGLLPWEQLPALPSRPQQQ